MPHSQLMASAVSCSGLPAEPAGTSFMRNTEDEEDISKMTPKTLKLYLQLPTHEYRWHYNLHQTISNNFYSSYFYSNFLKTHLKSQNGWSRQGPLEIIRFNYPTQYRSPRGTIQRAFNSKDPQLLWETCAVLC